MLDHRFALCFDDLADSTPSKAEAMFSTARNLHWAIWFEPTPDFSASRASVRSPRHGVSAALGLELR